MVPRIAKKRFSQNFLRDGRVVADIVEAGNFSVTDTVIEIGPGYGALTNDVLKKIPTLIAIEVDRDAVQYLRSKFSEDRLTVIEADCLDIDLSNRAHHYSRFTIICKSWVVSLFRTLPLLYMNRLAIFDNKFFNCNCWYPGISH